MKKLNKIVYSFILMLILVSNIHIFAQDSILQVTQSQGYDVPASDVPKASMIASVSNGEILWQENPDEVLDPASLSKLMTIYIVYEQIKSGKIHLNDMIKATQNDQVISTITILSNTPIIAGVEYPVQELIKMALVYSSNVATTMLANYINSDPDAFIDLMNQKAKELGMTSSSFTGPSGAMSKDYEGYYAPKRYSSTTPNQTTARDLLKLSIALLKLYPEITEITKQNSITVMEGTPYVQTLKNTNLSVEGSQFGFPGVTGLKTGSSDTAGYNYIASYQKDGVELVEVVLGVGNWPNTQGDYNRHKFGNAILKYVLDNFEQKTIFNTGVQTIKGEKVKVDRPITLFVEKGKSPEYSLEENQLKFVTPFGTLFQPDYTVTVEPAAKDEKESTETEQSTTPVQEDDNSWNQIIEFFNEIPHTTWAILLATIILAILIKKVFFRKF